MTKRAPIPSWFILVLLVVLAVHLLAGFTTSVTIGLMHGVSEFALAAREFELTILPYWRATAYVVAVGVICNYVWPIVVYFRQGASAPAPLLVQRRVISAPPVIAAVSFAPWCLSALFFPAVTLARFGRWTPDLLSQEVLSPLVNGFLAATTSYLLADWLFRTLVVPRVFPAGRLAAVPGSLAPGVRARLLLFLLAVAFTPLFTMLGLVRAAAVRVQAGMPADTVVTALAHASGITFFVYVALGVGLTLLLARSLTRPLGEMAAALRRVQRGELQASVGVGSADEVGMLADGVNAMVAALRENERILQTFGRVVEPSVRDHLLSGNVGLGGELRSASVLFCDLRGFTAIAERTPPEEVVATLNEFFTVMTAWVRECGGFVDKFIGDAMLVVFGLFDGHPDADRAAGAAAAVRCGLGMRERLAALNAARAAAGRGPLAVSAAIHTGEVLAGTIGAADRHEFTIIGDTVNVAARLQHLCKEQGCVVLVSESAYELARACGVGAELTPRPAVTLRGRSAPVRVFGVG